MKTPIALILDDPAPRVFVYYEHSKTRMTADGRPLLNEVPNSFLNSFCDVTQRFGLRGKFSVVPNPGGRGRLDEGVRGFAQEEITEWLDTVKTRLAGAFDFCPELLTHAGWIDLATGKMMDEQENTWSFRQSAETLTEYIALALQILKNVGIDATGVTSPWDFGVKNEDAYARAVSRAMKRVWDRDESWYFCRSVYECGGAQKQAPWLSVEEDGRRVAAIPGTIGDNFWQMMNTTDVSEEYVGRIADFYLTADGSRGAIRNVLESGGMPIMTTHWQSMFSNGAGTGLRALRLVAERVEKRLGDRVEWTSFGDLMRRTLRE